MSQTTKRALSASLKKLAAQKPIDKITVIDIAEDCGVNRQTFYYHFQDIYDLVEWTFTSESTKAVDGNKTYDTWQSGFLHVFQYALANRDFVTCVYHSISREHLENYLYQETYSLLISVVEEQAAEMSVRGEDKKFIADFYKFAFVGMVMEWIRNGMKEKPEDIIGRLSILIHGDIAKALQKYSTNQRA